MRRVSIVLSIAVAGCDGGGADTRSEDSGTPDTSSTCVREPAAADRVRHVVVSHPYLDAQTRSNTWEVLDLSTTGEITRPNRTFEMGRAIVGEIAFTLDGEIGVVAQEDGSVGVFKLDAAGNPTVIHAALKGEFYADRAVTGPDGTIYVLDNQWREHGGGIYKLDIDCDDNVTDGGLVVAAKLPAQLAFLGDTAIVAATNIDTSPDNQEAHAFAWGATPSYKESADAFPDDEQIVGGATLTHDGSYFLIGDTSSFASVPNRVAVVPVDPTYQTFGTPEMIPDVEDPITLIPDPDRLQVMAVSGFGNALFVLDRPQTTWRKREPTYVGARPQLPGGAVAITRGGLRGRVVIAENVGIRQARFVDGGVEDLGMFSLGDGIPNATGAVGVTP